MCSVISIGFEVSSECDVFDSMNECQLNECKQKL